LQAALAEISGRQVGMQAMTIAILKQLLVTLVRRSLNSTRVWLERFPILSGDVLRANQVGAADHDDLIANASSSVAGHWSSLGCATR
jgi:hypothetical protein